MRLIGAKLRGARLRRMLTQAELAERAATTEASVSRLENDLQQARISTIRKLAAALNVPTEELVAWHENAERERVKRSPAGTPARRF